MNINRSSDLDLYAKEFKEKTGVRVTFIAENGDVLAESDKDKKSMENHADREEIVKLKNGEFGYSIRESATTNKSYLYVVKKIDAKGESLYLRMGQEIDTIVDSFINLSVQMGAILLFSMLLAFVLTFRINRLLEAEINNVLEMLSMLLEKRGFEVKKYGKLYEFNKINKLLNRIGKKLRARHELKIKQNAKLMLSNRQKDEIISAIAHEFKNPIAIITSYCETLLREETNEEIRRRFLQKIDKNAGKMNELIDRLRLSLKLEDKKGSLNLEKIDVRKLALDIAGECEQAFKGRSIKVVGDERFLEIDRVLFSVALSNLAENALKYSEGGVEIVISDTNVSVCDKGIGIQNNELKKITKKFYRIDKNSWNSSLGLGLNIVENIVKLHGFKLKMESKEGEGSTFSIVYQAQNIA